MRPSSPHFFPLALPFILGFFLLLAFLVGLLEVGLLGYAYEKLGIDRRYISALLMLSLLGSYVNIPIAELRAAPMAAGRQVLRFGMRYITPSVIEWPRTILAINLGGAVIPTLLSAYLVTKHGLYGPALIAVAVVAALVHLLARPVPGVGIAVPTLVPPLADVAVALPLTRASAPALAYVAGSMGTLIGGDLLNLGKIQGLGAPVASIGGARPVGGACLPGITRVLPSLATR